MMNAKCRSNAGKSSVSTKTPSLEYAVLNQVLTARCQEKRPRAISDEAWPGKVRYKKYQHINRYIDTYHKTTYKYRM